MSHITKLRGAIPRRKSERVLTKLKGLPNRYFAETIRWGPRGVGHSLTENRAIIEMRVMNVVGS